MPSKVTFGDGSTITYTYAADGTKLRTVHKSGSTTITTDYCGNVIYENGVQKLLLTEEGYVTLADKKYHYYLKDHQGNNRVVVSQTGVVEETNHYYPFGGLFASTSSVQPYKYNGKELDTTKGLNLYDYGARMYDPTLGRFTTMDPMAEKYYSVSPYAYCGNNPVIRIDKDGKIWDTIWDLANVVYDAGAAVVEHIRGNHETARSHWQDFGMDVVAMAVPFVPAGTSKVVKAADKGADLFQATNKAEKTLRSSRAARREVMREQGIPTSQQPVSQSKNASGREYRYEVPKPYGEKNLKSVQQQTLDRSHTEQPHWEAGSVKRDNDGNINYNPYGRPRLDNNKGKINYDDK